MSYRTAIKLIPFAERANLIFWSVRGRTVPPPHLLKRHVVSEYARRYGIGIFVETGTFRGDMAEFARHRFDKVYTIELDPALYSAAKTRFRNSGVMVVRGDSAAMLPLVLEGIEAPALFWLDGHHSGAGTALGSEMSPILKELAAILSHDVRGHVILVDDARLFNPKEGYPDMEEVRQLVRQKRPDLTSQVKDDIIRITPPQ